MASLQFAAGWAFFLGPRRLNTAALFVCCVVLGAAAGEVKGELITLLTDIVARHQKARAQVTDDIVDAFMAVRPFKCFS